jgi:hypothetical protein
MAWKNPLWVRRLKVVGMRRIEGLIGLIREISTSADAAGCQGKRDDYLVTDCGRKRRREPAWEPVIPLKMREK